MRPQAARAGLWTLLLRIVPVRGHAETEMVGHTAASQRSLTASTFTWRSDEQRGDSQCQQCTLEAPLANHAARAWLTRSPVCLPFSRDVALSTHHLLC